MPSVGDRVRLKPGMRLGRYSLGEVISRDGSYIYVRVINVGLVVERYPCELEVLTRPNAPVDIKPIVGDASIPIT